MYNLIISSNLRILSILKCICMSVFIYPDLSSFSFYFLHCPFATFIYPHPPSATIFIYPRPFSSAIIHLQKTSSYFTYLIFHLISSFTFIYLHLRLSTFTYLHFHFTSSFTIIFLHLLLFTFF